MMDNKYYRLGCRVADVVQASRVSPSEAANAIKKHSSEFSISLRYKLVIDGVGTAYRREGNYDDAVTLLRELELDDYQVLAGVIAVDPSCYSDNFVLEALLRAYPIDVKELMGVAVSFRNESVIRLLNNRDEV